MKKQLRWAVLFVLTAVLIFETVVPVSAAGKGVKYELPELNMEITLPEDWVTLTRDIEVLDEDLVQSGLTKEDVISSFRSNYIYLNSLNLSSESEIVITMIEDESSRDVYTYKTYPEEIMEYLAESELEILNSAQDNATYTKSAVYYQREANFLMLEFTMDQISYSIFSRQYMTVVNGQVINITMHSYGDELSSEELSIMKSVVDSIHFTKNLTKKEAEGLKNNPEGVTLKADTNYSYDLNGDGKEETLKYKVSVNEDAYRSKVTLYINNKKQYTKTFKGLNASYKIADLDQKDKKLDLFLTGRSDNGELVFLTFQQYNGKTINIKTINGGALQGNNKISGFADLAKIKGDGTFCVISDNPVYFPAIGNYECYIPYKLKNGKIAAQSVNTFNITDRTNNYQYTAKTKIKVYGSRDTKSSAAFMIQIGDNIQITKLYLPDNFFADGRGAFVYVTNSQGEKGWIPVSEEETSNLFEEVPSWG